MEKNKNGNGTNGIYVAVIAKPPQGVQVDSIRMRYSTATHKKLIGLMRMEPEIMQNEGNFGGISVKMMAKTPQGVKVDSVRIDYGTWGYEKFMEFLRKEAPKVFTRQRGAEENVIWMGSTPLV